MDSERLIIFLNAPHSGVGRTSLAKSVGRERAATIHRELMETLLQSMGALRKVELRFSPDHAAEEKIAPWLRDDWRAASQGEGDLGQRLRAAFEAAFPGGAERVVIIGSDCPEVKSGDIRTAWKELKTHDLVVGPAIDGGYWLIGLRKPQPELFEGITWNSDKVLGETLQRARALGLSIQLLRILSRIDTQADWDAYVRERRLSQ